MEMTGFERYGVKYVEKDGLLYPDIEMPKDVPIGSVGKYGLLWISYMKENHLDRWEHLVRLGRANVTAFVVNEEAYELYEKIVEGYLKKHEEVDRSSTMDMWKLREQAGMLAEESVLHEVVYRFH